MAAKGGGHPIQITRAAADSKVRQLGHLAFHITAVALGFFLGTFLRDYASQNEFFPCARHSHIEDAHFLRLGLGADFSRHCLPGQRFIDLPSDLGALSNAHANAEFLVQQEGAHGIAQIELFGHIRHDDHGKFQSLAAVNTHDAHDIFTGP